MINSVKNRRGAFRILEEVSLSVTVLPKTEDGDIDREFESRRADFGIMTHLKYGAEKYLPEMRIIERKYPEISAYLKFLEKQIEYVSACIGDTDEVDDDSEKQVVDLSATGIRFETGNRVEVGDPLEITLVLYPDRSRMLVRCKANRVQSTGDGRVTVSAEFTRLHEEDQEALIKHLYKRQIDSLSREDEE
ncbi:MAG: PilZ domain-containing protein [Gammaproteobacteria bacterium]|nr:PilZ domain-containing protein [Gammaproteobacteria bacterium]